MPILPQSKIDAVIQDLSAVLDKHGINNELGASMLLIAGVHFWWDLGKDPEAFISGVHHAFVSAQKQKPRKEDVDA